MVYIGRVGGPQTSEILTRLPSGILNDDPSVVENDIEWERWAEGLRSVVPALIDERGEPYYRFDGRRGPLIYRFRTEELASLGPDFSSEQSPLPKNYRTIEV